MTNNNILQCALGVHRFDSKTSGIYFLCSICKRAKHYKSSDGYESWSELDERGNVVYYRNSCGYEEWQEYNENGVMIHHKESTGYKWRKNND